MFEMITKFPGVWSQKGPSDHVYHVIKFYQGFILNLKVFIRPKNFRPHEV